MSNLESEIERVLSSTSGERAIHAFLKKNPVLVINSFSRAWNANICTSEFPFGNNWRADHLVLSADSGMWHAAFIELESPNSKLYLKDGTPSRTLRVAQRQIEDWKDWARVNEPYLRAQFSSIFRKYRTAAQCGVSNHNLAQTEITDPNTVIGFDFHIVIGRRRMLLPDEQQRRARQSAYWGGPEIATYDRLVDCAKRIDNAEKELSALRTD